MILKIVAIDKMEDPELEDPIYKLYIEASRIIEGGKEHTIEFYTMINNDDLDAYRIIVETRAREVFDASTVAQDLVGETWKAADNPKKKGSVMSA